MTIKNPLGGVVGGDEQSYRHKKFPESPNKEQQNCHAQIGFILVLPLIITFIPNKEKTFLLLMSSLSSIPNSWLEVDSKEWNALSAVAIAEKDNSL